MELRQLYYFVTTFDAGTVSKAARRIGVAQPSLSQQIKALEHSLGLELFERRPRGVVLTEAGRALLPRARRILAEAADIEHNLKREADTSAGRLAVGAIPTIAPYVLPDAIAAVIRERRGCEVTIREGLTEHLLEALLDHQLDCALIATPSTDRRIVVEHLNNEELILVAPRAASFPTAEIKLDDLRDRPTIVLHEMHCLARQVNAFCELHGLQPHVVCQTTQLSTIFKLVSLKIGLSLVPEMAAAERRERGCRFIRLSTDRPTRPLGIAWRVGRRQSAAAQAFAKAVRRLMTTSQFKLRSSFRPLCPQVEAVQGLVMPMPRLIR